VISISSVALDIGFITFHSLWHWLWKYGEVPEAHILSPESDSGPGYTWGMTVAEVAASILWQSHQYSLLWIIRHGEVASDEAWAGVVTVLAVMLLIPAALTCLPKRGTSVLPMKCIFRME
jgi:hypothetical protein